MNYDDLTPDQMEKAKACKTVDELLELAKAEGIELSDAELEGMAGGLSWGDGDCSLFEEDCSSHCYADYR